MAIKHIVLLKFKEDTTNQQKEECYTLLENLKGKISGILNFKKINNVTVENLHQGFKEGCEITFDNETSRNNYLVHAEHVKAAQHIIANLKSMPEGVLVFDKNSNKKLTARSFCDGVENLLCDAKDLTKDELTILKQKVTDFLIDETVANKTKKISTHVFGLADRDTTINQNQASRMQKILLNIEERLQEFSNTFPAKSL